MNKEIQTSLEDQELEYTRGLRRRMVEKLTENNHLPVDPKEVSALAGVLSDMDRQSISIKRIKADEQNSKQNGEAAAIVAQMLMQLNGRNMSSQSALERTSAPVMPAGLEPPVINDGLLDMSPGHETYEQFSKRMNDNE